MSKWFSKLSCGLALSTAMMLCASLAQAQTVVVLVNGDPITNLDIDQRAKLNTMSSRKPSPREETLNELIDEKVKMKEAKKFGLDPTASDVDSAYATMGSRMRLSSDQLTQVLSQNGIRPDTLKHRLKAEMVWAQLVRGRYKENLLVGEKDIRSEVELKGENKDAASFEYRLQPVVLVVPRGADASVTEMRRKEAEALRARVQSCSEAEELFRSIRDATFRKIEVKTSADLPAGVREMLDKTEIGRFTPPEVTRQGIEMSVLCARTPTTIDTPAKREARDKLFAQKFEAQAKKYLQEIRRSSMIEYRSK